MAEHGPTPTPWELDDELQICAGNRVLARVVVNADPAADYEADEANAALIVRAVNSHAAMVGALKNFEIREQDADGDVWLVLHGNGTTGKGAFNLGKGNTIAIQVAQALEDQRRAALALAEVRE